MEFFKRYSLSLSASVSFDSTSQHVRPLLRANFIIQFYSGIIASHPVRSNGHLSVCQCPYRFDSIKYETKTKKECKREKMTRKNWFDRSMILNLLVHDNLMGHTGNEWSGEKKRHWIFSSAAFRMPLLKGFWAAAAAVKRQNRSTKRERNSGITRTDDVVNVWAVIWFN